MLRIAPFGKLYPLRRLRGQPDWRIRSLPRTPVSLALSILLVIGVGVLVWFVAVDPVRDALTGHGGLFRPGVTGAGG